MPDSSNLFSITSCNRFVEKFEAVLVVEERKASSDYFDKIIAFIDAEINMIPKKVDLFEELNQHVFFSCVSKTSLLMLGLLLLRE